MRTEYSRLWSMNIDYRKTVLCNYCRSSVFYNGLYMVPEIIITTVVAAILGNVPQITGVKNPKKDK